MSARSEPKKLTDRQLANLGKAFLKAKAEEAAAKALRSSLQEDLLDQLGIRGGEEVTVNGIRIVRRDSVTRAVDLGLLLTEIGRARFNSVTKPVVDTGKWNASVQAGNIPAEVVKKVEVETWKAPWVAVSEVA